MPKLIRSKLRKRTKTNLLKQQFNICHIQNTIVRNNLITMEYGLPALQHPWKIWTFIDNVLYLSILFKHVYFCWAKREANIVAYFLAQFASFHPISFSCTNSNLFPSIHETWIRDLSLLAS